ncbi:hypothetical protein EHQ92_12340 [Leptospira biflexa]|uniref:hypothetical protein n=1 Tax=Leptospira biflexa TaxID=172 RepID=UPI00109176D0|nr:hypothetical protein [Leptospira biflexa]TGM48621.1 hypothetical protein EHQ92_12340 [Leptospira biflexa]TGM48913.1 hypothetical protein EHQ88_00735 [Leptospira biflexa]
MTLFFKKKKNLSPSLSKEVLQRIQEESQNLGKEQILFVRMVEKQNGIGEVQVSFLDRNQSDTESLRFENEVIKRTLSKGEFQYEKGNVYFYPNVDLEWKLTPNQNIHRIQSNYEFSNGKLILEKKDFKKLRPILTACFLKEEVISLYMDGNICQLELETLDKEKEIRISDVLLTYVSRFYSSPLIEPHRLQ